MPREEGIRSEPDSRVLRGLDAGLDLLLRPLVSGWTTLRRLTAFGLIVLATTLTKFTHARAIVHPLIWAQIRYSGLRLLPLTALLSLVAGVILIGQAAVLLRQIGAQNVLGTVVVVALFRELAPLAAALLVLLRVGTATVVELATMRATGEVEALEALSIDPVHLLVVPRVIGLAISVFCLTVYFLIGTLLSGYLFCFAQDVPLPLADYLGQIARALTWADFLVLILKSAAFGATLAVVTCYQGLSRPLRLEQVPEATTRAVTHSLAFCLVLDVAFLVLRSFL
ncbi:MAG: ABC transporter permease [Verrucomicrobiae bacterium]|nr:ABC transporter permease [Verrucomicrobiae bacterium]